MLLLIFLRAVMASKVSVEMFGEAFWPDTIGLITGDLSRAVAAFGLGTDSIMSLDLIQWGNAYYNTTKCGSSEYVRNQVYCWDAECNVVSPEQQCYDMTLSKIMCQHGDIECLANLMQDCAATWASTMPNSESVSFNFHNCSSTAYQTSWRTDQQEMEKGMFTCARQINLRFLSEVQGCYDLEQKAGILWETFAKRTIRLGSARSGTPYTLINGKALSDGKTVIEAVCNAFDGVKPPICSSAASRSKE